MYTKLLSHEVKIFLTEYPWNMVIDKLSRKIEMGFGETKQNKKNNIKTKQNNVVMQNGFSYIPKPRK